MRHSRAELLPNLDSAGRVSHLPTWNSVLCPLDLRISDNPQKCIDGFAFFSSNEPMSALHNLCVLSYVIINVLNSYEVLECIWLVCFFCVFLILFFRIFKCQLPFWNGPTEEVKGPPSFQTSGLPQDASFEVQNAQRRFQVYISRAIRSAKSGDRAYLSEEIFFSQTISTGRRMKHQQKLSGRWDKLLSSRCILLCPMQYEFRKRFPEVAICSTIINKR